MTREEAHRILSNGLFNAPSEGAWCKAFIMAIETLKDEPCEEDLHREREQAYMQGYEDASKRFRAEPCEDCVSREAVLELVADYDLSMGQVVRAIHALPSVQPIPVMYYPQVTGVTPYVVPDGCGDWMRYKEGESK